MTATAWPEVALGEVVTIEKASISPASITSGTTYVGLENITSDGRFEGHGPVDAGELLSQKFRFSADHVLYGKLRPNLSKIACPDFEGICSTDILPIRPGPRMDRRFLLHFLRQPATIATATSLAAGANLPRLNPGVLAGFPVCVPPIEEQRRIAAVLDKADELRAKRRAALAQLDTLAEAIFLNMFTDELRGEGECAVVPLNDVVDQHRPICYGILKPGPDLDGGALYVRVVDMKDGGIDHRSVRRTSPEISHQYRRSLLAPGDLLMSIRGHVGRLAIVPPELNGANITQDSARIAVTGAEPRYVLEYLRLSITQQWMVRNTKGAAVRGLNIGDLRRVPLLLPSIEMQQRFVTLARAVDAEQSAARTTTSGLDDLFASLQQRAFRGEL